MYIRVDKSCFQTNRGVKRTLEVQHSIKRPTLMDKAIRKNCRRGLTDLSMAWIDYRKAYVVLPHLWILECVRMIGVTQNIVTSIENSMANLRTVLTSNQEVLGTVDIKKRYLSRRLVIDITVGDHYDTTVTDSKGHKNWLPTQERRMQDEATAIYG